LILLLAACDDAQPGLVDPNRRPGVVLQDATVLADRGLALNDAGEEIDFYVEADQHIVDMAVDAATFAPIAFDVQTRVGDRNTVAGLENRVTCEILDQTGEPIGGHDVVIEVLPDTGFERTDIGLIGHLARDYEITCSVPSLGLRDGTPAEWTVFPAIPDRVTTTLSTDAISAGGEVQVTCAAFDRFGNPVPRDDAYAIDVEPPPAQLLRRLNTLRFISAGEFEVTCSLPGAESAPGEVLSVRPGLPAHLDLSLFPQRPVYPVGAVVELVPSVTDTYDNPIPDAPLIFEADPALEAFGEGRFRCSPEGRYTLAVSVDGDTFEGRGLTETADILVDFGGPGITCDDPGPGDAIVLGAHPEELRGSVADIAGVASLTVDGHPIDLGADGRWRADVDVQWGLNVHEVVATDEAGSENSTFCAYLASEEYLNENQFLDDALLLRLGQGALDDGEPDRPLASLADVIRRVINAQALVDQVHRAGLAQNPIVPNECRLRVLGACLFRFGAEYTSLAIGGRNTLSMQIVDGGLRFEITIRNLSVGARLLGTLGNRARFDADDITIGLTFDVDLRANGNPDLSVRSIDRVHVGDLHSDFSGFLTGWILELAFWAFEGLIRDTLTDAIRGYLEDSIDQVLSDLLGNVNIGELSQGFDVPSLTGGEAIPLNFAFGLNRLDLGNGRMMVGLKTKVDGPNRVAGRSPGVALPTGTGLVELPGDRTVGAAVQLGLLNQIMHRLWRAGWFDADAGGLVSNANAGLPDGAEVFLSFPQPPVVVGEPADGGATIRIFIPPLTAGVVYPGFFVEPFRVQVAGELSATVNLVGERDLQFDDVDVRALHLAFSSDVPQRSRQILEDTLERILQSIIDRALNDGLPVLPIPEFPMPDGLQQYDLPPGTSLGLRQPRLTGSEPRWVLDGNFGE
jgi:hypothetical protein